jgi:hypothetical protein
MLKVGLAVFAALALCAQDEVDNPAYKNWAKGKPGTSVTMKMVTNYGTAMEMESTMTLEEVTADHVTISTVTKMGGNAMPAQKMNIPAKVKKTEAGKDAPKPEEGDEEIEVGGKKIKCHWVKSVTEANGSKTTSKVWSSDEIPGTMAKMESQMEGAMKGTTSSVVTAYEWK